MFGKTGVNTTMNQIVEIISCCKYAVAARSFHLGLNIEKVKLLQVLFPEMITLY